MCEQPRYLPFKQLGIGAMFRDITTKLLCMKVSGVRDVEGKLVPVDARVGPHAFDTFLVNSVAMEDGEADEMHTGRRYEVHRGTLLSCRDTDAVEVV